MLIMISLVFFSLPLPSFSRRDNPNGVRKKREKKTHVVTRGARKVHGSCNADLDWSGGMDGDRGVAMVIEGREKENVKNDQSYRASSPV